MTPYDWVQMARACLPEGQFLLWKAEYQEQVKQQVAINEREGKQITYPKLMGEDLWALNRAQMQVSRETLLQCSDAAINAWRRLPEGNDTKPVGLASVKQGPEKPSEEFLSRVIKVVDKAIKNEEAAQIIIKQLAFENANPTCQALLRPIKGSGDLNEFVKICAEVMPSYLQGVAFAAAMKGENKILEKKHLKILALVSHVDNLDILVENTLVDGHHITEHSV